MEPVTIPTLWKDEAAKLPVWLLTNSGSPATGIAYGQITVKYTRHGDSALQAHSPGAEDWSERGEGLYALALPGTIINQEGLFGLLVIPPDGNQVYRAVSSIDKRVEARLLNAAATGFSTDTVGKALEDAAEPVFQVFANPQYDYSGQIVDFTVWAHRNGQLYTTPTSCQVILRETATGTVIANLTSASPDGNGRFYLQKPSVSLSPNKNYSVHVRVTIDGVDYTSGDAAQSLN